MEPESDFDEFKWLKEYAPCFEIDAKNIEVIHEPKDFYANLKSLISESKKRVLLSSLYLGTGSLEKDLVDTIERNLNQNSDLRVKVLLDHSRGLRGPHNSKTMLDKLITKFKSQFHLFLYHTPNLRGLAKRFIPDRVNETIGVLHMKIYIGDDTLIISGANLSNDYFDNRQDRYIVIRNSPQLCNFFESLIDTISEYSFKVNENGEIYYENEHHPFESCDKEQFALALGTKIRNLLNNYVNKSFEEPQDASSELNSLAESDSKAYIYPLLQLKDCDITDDEQVTNRILQQAPKSSKINLTAGYFNLIDEYEKAIVTKSEAEYKILVSSPEANGFFTATGLSKNVPKIYSYLEETFFNFYTRERQAHRIEIYEYQRNNWTFHAKGLWYYPTKSQLPTMTVVGSSNFGYRSVYRDLEAQLVIHTKNKIFANKLEKEQKNLFLNSTKVTADVFLTESRVVPIFLRLLSRIVRSYF